MTEIKQSRRRVRAKKARRDQHQTAMRERNLERGYSTGDLHHVGGSVTHTSPEIIERARSRSMVGKAVPSHHRPSGVLPSLGKVPKDMGKTVFTADGQPIGLAERKGVRIVDHRTQPTPDFEGDVEQMTRETFDAADSISYDESSPTDHEETINVVIAPTVEQFEEMVALAKSKKKSMKVYAQRQGWGLVGPDPKDRESWAMPS